MLRITWVKRLMNVSSKRRSRHSHGDQMVKKKRNSPISDCLSPAFSQHICSDGLAEITRTNDHLDGTNEGLFLLDEFGVHETASC